MYKTVNSPGLATEMPSLGIGSRQVRRPIDPDDADEDEDCTPRSLARGLGAAAYEWDELQLTRGRDAVYTYLSAVFAVATEWSRRGTMTKKFRKACRKLKIVVPREAELFAFIIRHTSDADLVDARTLSKWSRALRYAARFNKGGPLRHFIKGNGGLNACAKLYAVRLGRGGKSIYRHSRTS